MSIYDVITDRFLHMTIYSRKLTSYHLDQILHEIRSIIIDYTNWLHSEGYLPVAHKDYQERTWYKDMDGKHYREVDLYHRYLKQKSKEKSKIKQ